MSEDTEKQLTEKI